MMRSARARRMRLCSLRLPALRLQTSSKVIGIHAPIVAIDCNLITLVYVRFTVTRRGSHKLRKTLTFLNKRLREVSKRFSLLARAFFVANPRFSEVRWPLHLQAASKLCGIQSFIGFFSIGRQSNVCDGRTAAQQTIDACSQTWHTLTRFEGVKFDNCANVSHYSHARAFFVYNVKRDG